MSEMVKPGEKLYSVAVGNFAPWKQDSAKALKMSKALPGFVAEHVVFPRGTLLFFRSAQEAEEGREKMRSAGITCGKNICKFAVGADGVPVMEGNAR